MGSGPTDPNARKGGAAKGFNKNSTFSQNLSQNDFEDDEQPIDTNPENNLIESKKNRKSVKTDHYFNFNQNDSQLDFTVRSNDHKLEEGLPEDELVELNEYYLLMKGDQDFRRPRRKLAKRIRVRNHFFTSSCFMLFHILLCFLFWIVAVAFPVYSAIGCQQGVKWMSHVAMGIFMGMVLVFDFVFAAQYATN